MLRFVALALALGASAGELLVAVSNVSSFVAICPAGAAECQLNLHVVHWAAPTSPTSTGVATTAAATFAYAGGAAAGAAAAAPVYTRSEYTLHDTTSGRAELPAGSSMPRGRVAQQFVAQLTASAPRAALPRAACVAINASDATTGEAGVPLLDGGAACLNVSVLEVASPQRAALGAYVDHPIMTYTCPADAGAPCLAFGHVVVSVYGRDATHALYGGGSFARRAPDGGGLAGPLSARGVRALFQSKPTTGQGDFAGALGPRVQVAVEALVLDRDEAARDMCFAVWAADALTLELADATEYDVDKGYPPADEDGVFCWTPVEITGKGAT